MRGARLSLMIVLCCGLSACGTSRTLSNFKLPSFAPDATAQLAPLVEYGASMGGGSAGSHTVLSGDTLFSIARQYKLSFDDLVAINHLSPPYHLAPGTRLELPPPGTYRVRKGDSLPNIARMFGVNATQVATLNKLRAPYRLGLGQVLKLPRPDIRAPEPATVIAAIAPEPIYAEPLADPKPTLPAMMTITRPASRPQPTYRLVNLAQTDLRPPVRPAAKPELRQNASLNVPAPVAIPEPPDRAGGFLKPVQGQVISRYGGKSGGLYNEGLNIAAPKGTPVRAAENGTIVYVGQGVSGYGNLVLLKHADGFITAYAHLDKTLATAGQVVKRGQPIGTVGSTGNVARAQLHFEIRKGRESVDPLTMI